MLDARASLVDVQLDGKPAALRRDGALYALGLQSPGSHTLTVRFLLGQAEDRFTRTLDLRLPPAGPTQLSLRIGEPDIDLTLADGVITAQRSEAKGTRIDGAIDGETGLNLTWRSNRSERGEAKLALEVQQATLFTVQPALITGVAHLQVTVAEGAVNRLQLPLPPGVEIVRVEGPRVLQWQGDAEAGVLTLLLTHLVREPFAVAVHFQAPAEADGRVRLRGPAPPKGAKSTGVAGVQAPAGLDLKVLSHVGAELLDLRGLPSELLDLTESPLLFGYRHDGPATVELSLTRNAQVALTNTLIDEIEASSVLLEDGTEISKMKLHLRNNSRQHLSVYLPDGSRLTHALIDGRPIRPALEDGHLLFPLRQSVRLDADGRFHRVRPGENLGSIAYTYYSNPERWPLIAEANEDELGGNTELYTGQRLRIPPLPGANVEESRFVLELAFERTHDPLGNWGETALTLPKLDVEAVKATWHVYLPHAITPLHFEGNLQQYSAIRYDPFRRAREFLMRALIGRAHAGGYKSILSRRRGIYLADAAAKGDPRAALGSFPLVGRRYRFKRLLMGAEIPTVRLTYLAAHLTRPVQLGAFALAALLASFTLRRGRKPWQRILLGAVLAVPLLALGHTVLGVNRHLVWGLDAGLIWLLLSYAKPRLPKPEHILHWATLPRLAAAIGLLIALTAVVTFPLILPLGALGVLSVAWLRVRLTPARPLPVLPTAEVPHA